MDNLVGKTLGQYQLVELIHQGENTVYRGFQPSMNRYVAVKVLNPERARDLAFVQQFRRDMQTIVSLEHPHILPVFDYGQEDDLLYIVTRYVEGGSLKDRIPPAFSLQQAQQVVNALADALDAIHNRGLVYGNLKPSNILIDELGQPLLADFGYTQGIDVGTAGENAYLSPEQRQGVAVDRRTDVFALGALLYQMTVGEPPAPGIVPSPRLKKPDLPVEVEKIILRAMAQDPSQRFQTAGELSHTLNLALPSPAILTTQPTPVVPPSVPAGKPEPESEKRGGLGWILGGAAVVGLLLLLGCLLFAVFFGPRRDNSGNIIVVVPTPAPAVPAVIALQDTNIRSGPGTEYDIIGTLKKGQSAEAVGRSADGLWWVIKVQAVPSGQGWVSAELTQAQNTANLPAIQPPPLPTATPTREVAPSAPKAVIEGTTKAQVGQPVGFTGRNSQVAAGSQIVVYEWDFDDGATATGADVSHVYSAGDTYKVSLTVTDNNGLSDTTTHKIEIEALPEPPTPEPTEVPPEPTQEPGADLEGINWGLDGTLPGTEITAFFQDGVVNGSGGCNTYNATYETDGRNLTISPVTSSQLMCEEDIMTQEAEYLQNLVSARQYRVEGNRMRITGGVLQQALNYTQR